MSQTQSQLMPNGVLVTRQPLLSTENTHRNEDVPLNLPTSLAEEISKLPKLTKEQCGHLRHFYNLASQPDGDWSLMGGASGQDHDEGAYRYQLAFMAYAAGAAHYHRLPALRSVFRSLIEKLIKKMLHPDTWGYWYLTSQSGKRLDPDLKELRKPWSDPVCRENVMYSGHLLLMVSLYSMLFADDSYDEKDSIVFNWEPMWWGMGPERYCYNRSSLQKTILGEMERDNWMGSCCEPNMVFIVCNQFPFLATRYNDVRNNTNIIDDILPKYKEAWNSRGGFLSENGLFRRWYSPNQDRVLDSQDISHTAWISAYMAWNHDKIKAMYPNASAGFLQRIDDRINIRPPVLANEIRRIASSSKQDPESASVIEEARKAAETKPPITTRSPLPTFGFVAQWLSEIAGPKDLDPLLRHADQYLNPTWRNGGLYYARQKPGWDEEGNYLYMEPYSGNGAIGYARLNVQDGQKKMWDHPWTKKEVEQRPCIEGVSLESGVDFLRGTWLKENKTLVTTLKSWAGQEVNVRFSVKALKSQKLGVYMDGILTRVIAKGENDDARWR